MEKIRVMIAEDQTIMRNALAQGLDTDFITVTGLADDGQKLMELVKKEIPDVVVLDLKMPVLDGHEVLKLFAERYPTIKTIILSGEYTEYYAVNVIVNGAAAFLKKSSDMEEVIEAIKGVYEEGYYFNEVISKDILEHLNSEKKIYYLIENKRFSEKEIEVLKQICKDIPTGIIADNLNISESTLRFHRRNLLKKTESDSIVSLVKYAIKQGITT